MIIFEDSKLAPVSKFITKIYDDTVVFSEGNANLSTTIEDNLSQEYLLVFVDYTPDYDEVAHVYPDLCSEFKDKSNVYIFPIPCIEYFVLQMIAKFIPLKDERELNYNYRFLQSLKSTAIIYTEHSYELFCKHVLSIQLQCMKNENDTKHPYYGDFYREGCRCKNRPYCPHDKIPLHNKYTELLRLLPVHNEKFDVKLVEDIYTACADIFQLLHNTYNTDFELLHYWVAH